MIASQQTQSRLQSLESVEDFQLLVPGDIVPTGHIGPRLDGPMLVSKESDRQNGILFLLKNLRWIYYAY